MKKTNILTLFLTMMKIGLFTFGGGYAMIALLENEFIEKKKWIDKDEFLSMAAIAESTPGPIAINAATYIGYRIAGFAGSLVSTVAICIPSFVIIYLISIFFDSFMQFTWAQYAFKGIQVAVIYLIFSAGIRMFTAMKKSAFNIAIVSAVTVIMIAFSVFAVSFSAIFYILICGTLGVAVYLVRSAAEKRGGKEK